MKGKIQWFAAILGCSLGLLSLGHATQEAEILAAIAQLRDIQPTDDTGKQAELNARMDAAWAKIEAQKSLAAPVVIRKLREELDNKNPDQFFLLDMAYLAVKLSGSDTEPTALQALARIDPEAKIIQYNDQELFYFVYGLAKSGRPEVLAQIDRLFLPAFKGRGISIPQHAFVITPELMCVFLYGVTGPDAELHIAEQLKVRPDDRIKLMKILYYLGSARTAEAVKNIILKYPDQDTVTHGITVLMQNCGPIGRELVLQLDSKRFDAMAKKYYDEIRSEVLKASYNANANALEQFEGSITKLSDEQLKARLQLMYDNFGVENELSPSVIVESKLPARDLIGELRRIRSRMFYRLNSHAIDDVLITNQIINTLEYRN